MATLNPLPSLIRASAQDAGNSSMRKGGRDRWDTSDWNAMCDTQERLVRAAYGRATDHNNPDICYLRFQIAEQMERRGEFTLRSNAAEILARIDAALGISSEAA